jgi:hypothetical protein
VNVTFAIEISPDRFLSEEDLAADFEKLRPELAAAQDPLGTIYLDAPAYSASAVFYDTLEVLIERLCLGAPAALASGSDVDFRLFTEPLRIRMTLNEDDVLIFEDEDEIARLPKAELLPAQSACGARYVAFVEKLVGDAPDAETRLMMLRLGVRAAEGAIR